MKITNFLSIFIFVFILSFISNHNVYAENYFDDNFNSNLLNKWEVVNGSSNIDNGWKIENGKLVSEVNKGQSSYLKALVGKDLDNFIIETEAVNYSGVDQPILFRISQNFSKYYMFNIRYKDPYWPQDGDKIVLGKFINGQYFSLVDINTSNINQGVVHKIRILVDGNNIKVFIDSIKMIDIIDSDTTLTKGSIGLMSWGGDYHYRSNKNVFDNFKVTSLDSSPRNKIIVIPGLGASWNPDAMVYGKSVPNSEWTMTPFVKNYDALINSLNDNGLIKNKDYFVWNYDWRKPLKDISYDLNSFIKTNIGESGVDLIGHSLGGLVARVWEQDHLNSGREINVYTMGTPHGGSLDAYEAWNGGKIADYPTISSIALNLAFQLNKKSSDTNINSFRNFVPILKDLMPTSDFVKKANKTISLNSLQNNNSYLIQKNNEAKNLKLNLTSYVGTGQKTKEWINLVDGSIFDKALGIWPDGKPFSYSYGDGDIRVLKKSASLNADTFIEMKSNHNEIVNKSLNNLLYKLDLSSSNDSIYDDFSNNLVFFMGSPAKISVACDQDSPVEEQNGFVIIKNKNYKKCLVNLNGTGHGDYHLITGNTDQNNWHYFQNVIELNENLQITINPVDGDLLVDDSNISFLNKLISDDVNLLTDKYGNNINLKNSLISLNNKDINALITAVFNFRKEKKENEITNRIIENSELLFEIFNKNYSESLAKTNYNKSLQDKSLVDKVSQLNVRKGIVIKENSAGSYKKAEELINDSALMFKSKKYSESFIKSLLASKYLSEV